MKTSESDAISLEEASDIVKMGNVEKGFKYSLFFFYAPFSLQFFLRTTHR